MLDSKALATNGFSVRRCIRDGSAACCTALRLCSVPTMPAAGSACPMLDLLVVRARGAAADELAAALRRPKTAATAPTSMGSPREVPVPCICRTSTCRGGQQETTHGGTSDTGAQLVLHDWFHTAGQVAHALVRNRSPATHTCV